jgi:hypothetical protein
MGSKIIMSRKVFLDAFFNQFVSFLGELKGMYPEDPDFPNFVTAITLIRNTNPMLAVNYIKSEVIDPFQDKISARDESFFMDQDYTQKNADIDVIHKLKEYVREMSPESKEVVWQYIELLMKLTLKIMEN